MDSGGFRWISGNQVGSGGFQVDLGGFQAGFRRFQVDLGGFRQFRKFFLAPFWKILGFYGVLFNSALSFSLLVFL